MRADIPCRVIGLRKALALTRVGADDPQQTLVGAGIEHQHGHGVAGRALISADLIVGATAAAHPPSVLVEVIDAEGSATQWCLWVGYRASGKTGTYLSTLPDWAVKARVTARGSIAGLSVLIESRNR